MGAAWTAVGTPPWTSSLVLDTYYIHAIVSDGTQWFVKVSDATGSALTATDPVLWSTMQDLGDPYWFYIGDPYTNFYWNDTHSDWIYERDYVSPEPITGTGSEETNQAYCTQAADPATSLIMASPPSIPADGASTSTITVQLKDGFGNNLISGGDTVFLFTTLGSLGSVTDNGNGTYTATLSSGLTEGIATITGTANGDAIADSAAVDLVAAGGSYNQCNYSFRKLITLQASQVTATQTNFPVLIDIPSDTDLEHTSNGGDVQSIFGTDIVFTAADGFTLLDYEIEKYDPVTGELVAWVEIPNLSSSVNTIAYMYYGNASANNQQDTAGTWDEGGSNNFAGVWHLSQNPSAGAPQFLNSFSDAYDGTANSLSTGNQVNGQIDGSLSFDDSNERHVNVPHSAGLQFGTDMTISAWVRTSDTESDTGLIVAKWQGGGNSNYWLGKFDATNLAFYVDGSQNVTAGMALINDGFWHHVVGVADVTNSLLRIYVDGTQANTAAYSGTSETGTSPLHIGNSPDSATQEWEDGIDEVRVSDTARDADWIATEHNNQSSPATFHVIGSEELSTTYCGADPATSTITANPITITADGVSTSTMTVQLKDSFGTNLTIGGDTVTIATDLGTLSGTVIDNGDGTYTETLTSAVTPGTATITGTVNASAITDDATVIFAAASWVQCDYQFRKMITIDSGQVTGDQTNFPVLINLSSDSELAANARSDGFDIAFADSTGLVQLDYEREEFDSSTGELVAWVRIPNLSSSVNTVIYLYYGDPDATDQANPVGVWDSNFQGVWHLEELVADEAVGGTHTDSSGTGNDGTQNNNGPVAGQIGGAQDFDGTADEVTVSGFTGISSFPVTISAWSAATADNGSFRAAATIGTASDEYLGLGWSADPDPNEQTEIAARDIPGGFKDMGGPIVANNDWTHLVGVFVSETERRFYVDGAFIGTDVVSVTEPSAYDKFQMGQVLDNANGFMQIDEVRVSNSIRTLQWIETEYNNQNAPASFYTVGSAEPNASFCGSGGGPSSWWNCSYDYRMAATVSTGSNAITSGYSVSVTFDHASLVSGGKSLASGDDIRVTYWNGSGWTELDRVLDPSSSWNSATTTIWFQAQAAVAAWGSDTNYTINYGNASAAAPPANGNNVFVRYDGFESGDFTGWDATSTATGDTLTVVGTPVYAGSNSARSTVDTVADAQTQYWWNVTSATTYYARIYLYLDPGFFTSDHVTVMQFIDTDAGWVNIIATSINDTDDTLYLWNDLAGEAYGFQATTPITRGVWHTLEMQATMATAAGANDGAARLWMDGSLEIEATGINLYEINTPNVDTIDRFSTGFYWANPRTEPNTIYVDEVSLRDYVHTDPLVSLDAEQISTCPSASNATGKIYWIDEGTVKIQRAKLDGSSVEDLVVAADGLITPKRLALDTLNGKMYWTDIGTDDIHRANLDGSNVEALGIAGIVDPRGIDLDVAAGKVYWAETGGGGAIQRANLDGTGLEPLVASAGNPRGLAVDVAGGKIYWTEFTSNEIRRANLNGTGVETLVTGLNLPRGIELDVAGGKMYWTDIGAQKIQRADMAVSTAEDLLVHPTPPIVETSGITLDLSAGKIYWTDYNLDHIRRADLDGSNDEDIITTGLTIPMGIEVHGGGVIVNSTGDGTDFIAGDGICETASGNNVCTLRAAIEEANASSSINAIEFNIPTSDPNYNTTGNNEFTIQPVLALPTITDPVRIDGYTQPGAQPNSVASPGATDAVLLIEIDGTNTGASVDGLTITAGSSTVRGLVINRFDTDISSDGIFLDTGGGNIIEGNYLGTNVTGVLDFGNAGDGVAISSGSSSNTVGGTDVGARNLLSGNGVYGVAIGGAGSDSNLVIGNYIGTNADGSTGLGNTFSGVKIQTTAASNTIGGTTTAERNIISGNLQHGVFIGDSANNIVQGNYIGTDAAGTGAIANTNHGVRLNSTASSNTIGGAAAGAGNLIANNSQKGISLADTVGTGNPIQRNSIYANTDIGIDLMDPGDPGNGVTPNDAGDGDSGPNNLLNYPVIYSATITGGNVTVIGEARPGATVEFFEADGDGSGYGEGQTFIDSKVEGSGDDSNSAAGSTDGTANQFTFTFAVGSLIAGDDLTATATDGSSNTSEFALNVTAAASGPISIYRSVGTTATDLNTSAHNVTISGTTATFAGTMPDNIGVGDALAYNNGSAQLAFITGRTTSTVYTVADKDGGTPASASNVAVGVYRSYTSLFNWEASSENANITEPVENDVNPSTDLVTANTIMMVAAYGDGTDSTSVTINSWTTGASNYIKIYTPTSTSEVGNSQRHSGVWDASKYYIETGGRVLYVQEGYVRIEGLQISQTSVSASGDSGILVETGAETSEMYISHNIIRGVNSTTWHTGIEHYTVGPSSVAYIWNNIIYDFQNATFGQGINPTDPDLTAYIYNNTIFNNGNGINSDAGGVTIGKNNISFSNSGSDYIGMDAASDNNLGKDAAFAGDANYVQTSQTAVQMFVDPSGSPRDLHILSTSDAHDAGADLSGDANLPFSDDIDGESRSGSWDIGADEQITAGTELLAKVETFTANAGTGNQIISTTGFLPKAVLFWITDQTASGSSANSRFGRGWTDGTNQAAAATAWADGTNNTWGSMVNDKSILLINGSGTILADASIVSLNVNGFTINWSTAGGSRLVTYLALGGPGLTDVKVGSMGVQASSPTESITGLGFQPEGLLMFGARDDATYFGDTQEGHAFGAAASSTSRHSSGHRERNNGFGFSGYRDNEVLSMADDTSVPEVEWDLQSFDADGFTLARDVGPDEYSIFSWLALDGIEIAEGILTQPAATGDQSITSLSFTPSAVMFDGGDKASVSGYESQPEIVHGVATGPAERSAIWTGRNGTSSDTDLSTSAVIRSLSAGTPSVDAEADFVSMNSDGFTINWDSPDATQRKIGWVALGPGTVTPLSGLLAHWTLDEGTGQTAADSTGNGYDGTLGITAGVDSEDPGWVCVTGGKALNFDGSDDELDVSSVVIGNSAAWTISAWIKVGPDTLDQRTIYSEGDTVAPDYLILYVDQATSTVRFYSEVNFGTSFAQVIGTANVEDNAWHLVTMVQRSKTDRELYVDGVSDGISTQNAGTLTMDTASIGALNYLSGPIDWFKGSMDDVRIYGRDLSISEISTLAASPPTDCSATAMYYSVGTDNTALYSANASASSGTLTLASAGASNIGVGDEIREGSNRYYITGRNSSTEFTIQNSAANSGTPGDTNITFGSTAITIYRAYNSLLAAFDSGTGVQDSSHLNTTDLVAGNFQLNIAGYNDGPDNSSGILIEEPWNTGASNYIRVFAPTDSTEVGTSQRHTGVAGTGYRLAPTTVAPAGFYNILEIANDNGYVRIEGLEFDGTGLTGGESVRAILIGDSTGLSNDVRISHSLIYNLTNSTLYDSDESDIEAIETQNTDNSKIFNNIIYNITNISTHISSSAKGIELNDAGLTQYVYNNTVYDIQNTGSTSYARGITDDGVGTTHAKNNYVGLIDSAGGTEAAFFGTFASEDYNVASDTSATGANSVDSQATYTSYFVDSTAGNEDLHLLDDSSALWTSYGEDLDSDPNLAVTDDIDGDARDATQPDIGADEYVSTPLTALYYSVGTDSTALYSANASASSGTLTLASAAANNVGVGDEVREGSNRYYITGRNSSTEFTIQNSAANGGTPGATNITFSSTAITIYRAFNSLDDAFLNATTGALDSTHLNTSDLVANNFQLSIAGYNDGPDPSKYVRIEEPWVTGPTNYIRVYSPTDSSEVGVSQRHNGTGGSGYRIAPTGAVTNAFFNFIFVGTDNGYVRIEGIEIDGASVTNGENLRGLLANDTDSLQQDVRFTHNLIHDLVNSNFDDGDNSRVRGIMLDDTDNSKVSNNIIFNIDSVSSAAGGGAQGIVSTTGAKTHYVYNNTLYDIQSSSSAEGARGIYGSASNTIHAQNNYVGLVDGGVSFPEFAFNGTFATEDYNVAFDGSTTGPNSVNSQATYASYFADVTPGSEDLHLVDDSNALWTTYGADLDADPNHPITDDIDGDARDATQPDVGADEYTAAAASTIYRSIGTDTNPIYDVGNASINSGQTTVTFAGGASLPVSTAVGAVGQGDKLVIGAETFYILSRTDATHVEVQTAAASTHSIASYSITRTYNDIQSWEDPCGATPCLPNSSGGRGGDLVSDTRIEVGVAYKDGVFAPTARTLFQDSTTDSSHYMHLTVAAGQQHDGTAGSGVIVDGASIPASGGNLFQLRDSYVRMEWLEIRNYDGDTALGNPINVQEAEAEGAFFSHLLIHDYTDNSRGAINIYDDTTVRNSIFYNGVNGIRIFGSDNPQVTIENVTIYNMSDDGVRAQAAGTYYIKNTISVGSGGEDFDINDAGVVIDPSSGYNLYTDVQLGVHPGTNNQSPPASLEDLFVSIVVSSEDLHIEGSGNAAIDNGTSLSGSFTVDIDEDGRPQGSAWDIGADEVVGAGAFAYWNFDEGGAAQTAADSTGNGRDGTLGTTTGVEGNDPSWSCVTGGNALEFDGSDDQVLVGDHDLLSAISISAWINWDAVTANEGIISKRTSTEVLGNWSLRMDDSGGGTLEWLLWTGSGARQVFNSTSAINSDGWTHVAFTFDEATNTAKFYINGALDNTTTTFTNNMEDNPQDIIIGYAGQSSQYFDGHIDDLRLYDYALSQGEVTTLAASTVTDCAPPVGTNLDQIHYRWRDDDGVVKRAADQRPPRRALPGTPQPSALQTSRYPACRSRLGRAITWSGSAARSKIASLGTSMFLCTWTVRRSLTPSGISEPKVQYPLRRFRLLHMQDSRESQRDRLSKCAGEPLLQLRPCTSARLWSDR